MAIAQHGYERRNALVPQHITAMQAVMSPVISLLFAASSTAACGLQILKQQRLGYAPCRSIA